MIRFIVTAAGALIGANVFQKIYDNVAGKPKPAATSTDDTTSSSEKTPAE